MQQDPVCRGCLAVEGKFSSLHDFSTAQAYENLTGCPVLPSDGYPQQLCSFCRCSLLKFAEFRAQCLRVLQMLHHSVTQGQSITKQITLRLISSCADLKPKYVQTKTITIDATTSEPEIIIINDPSELCGGTDTKTVKEEIVGSDLDDIPCEDLIEEDSGLDSKYNIGVEVKPDVQFTEFSEVLNHNHKNRVKKVKKEVTKRKKRLKRINTVKTLNSNQIIIDYAKNAGFNIQFLSIAEQVKEVEDKKNEIVSSGYNCKQCGKHFRDTDTLERHTKVYHCFRAGSYVCDICTCVFDRKLTLKSHIENHSWVFTCQRCDFKTNQQKTLMAHRSFHEGKKYQCQYCDKVFEKITTFLTHVRLIHASELPWCRLCGEFFIGDKGVRRHVRLTHNMVEEFPCVCAECDKRFQSDAALERHATVRGCKLSSCAQCGDSFLSEQLLKYHLVHRHFPGLEPDSFDCERCNLRFHNEAARSRHSSDCGGCGERGAGYAPCGARGECGERGAWCATCGARGETGEWLTAHVFSAHYIFRCELCGKQFTNAGYFKRHYTLAHSARARARRGRPLACDTQQTKKGPKLSKREPPKPPPAANPPPPPPPAPPAVRKWRVVSETQVVAERSPGGDARRVRLICEVCGKGFPTSASLALHQRTHTGENRFSCAHCRKGFKQKQSLQMHERVHTGERPHACAACPKTFRTYPGLRRHFLIHSGERSHVCALCDKTFQTSTSVKMHIRTAHLLQPWPARRRKRNAAPLNQGL